MTSERATIIPTDPGIDDTLAANYLAKLQPPNEQVLVSSFGNGPESLVYQNLRTIHQVFSLGENWSIARGPTGPLDPSYAKYSDLALYKGNGDDLIWGASPPEDCPATNPRLVDFKTLPSNVDEIISLAPLTAPVLLQRMGANPNKVLIMGGAFLEGNVKALNKDGVPDATLPRVGEWNVYKDAPSAQEFFQRYAGTHVWVFTKDVCMEALLSAKRILETEFKPTIDHRFMQQILQGWAIGYEKINPEVWKRGLMLADLIAVISYKNPSVVGWENNGIEVDTTIGPNLGRTTKSSSSSPVNIATEIIDHKTLFEAINSTVFGE